MLSDTRFEAVEAPAFPSWRGGGAVTCLGGTGQAVGAAEALIWPLRSLRGSADYAEGQMQGNLLLGFSASSLIVLLFLCKKVVNHKIKTFICQTLKILSSFLMCLFASCINPWTEKARVSLVKGKMRGVALKKI